MPTGRPMKPLGLTAEAKAKLELMARRPKTDQRTAQRARIVLDCAAGLSNTAVNGSLRGWYAYFQHSKTNVFASVDGYVRRRLRSVLQWREDGVGQGIGVTHQRWPNEWFARRGLLSLTAEHEWTRTIVKLRTH